MIVKVCLGGKGEFARMYAIDGSILIVPQKTVAKRFAPGETEAFFEMTTGTHNNLLELGERTTRPKDWPADG